MFSNAHDKLYGFHKIQDLRKKEETNAIYTEYFLNYV
jgi:hypothetical protein